MGVTTSLVKHLFRSNAPGSDTKDRIDDRIMMDDDDLTCDPRVTPVAGSHMW